MAGVVALALIIWAVVAYPVHTETTTTENTNNNNTNTTQNEPESTDQTPAPTGTTPSNLSYNQALMIYGPQGNNYRIQIAANCQATPSTLSLKKGVKFMLDNRDSVSHTFVVDNQNIILAK